MESPENSHLFATNISMICGWCVVVAQVKSILLTVVTPLPLNTRHVVEIMMVYEETLYSLIEAELRP